MLTAQLVVVQAVAEVLEIQVVLAELLEHLAKETMVVKQIIIQLLALAVAVVPVLQEEILQVVREVMVEQD
jgi:hypothetical protein